MFRSKKSIGNDIVNDTGEVAHNNSAQSGSDWLTKILSVAALLLSAISLYHTVLKQADMSLYVSDTISYTRDPEGSHEVFIIPLTITNGGARDGVISSLKLVATNKKTGQSMELSASYFARADYFLPPAASPQSRIVQRPKEPFAPISVQGYSSFAGTVLFYPKKRGKKFLMDGAGRYDFVLTAENKASQKNSWLDGWWHAGLSDVAFSAISGKTASYFDGWISVGNTWRMAVQE